MASSDFQARRLLRLRQQRLSPASFQLRRLQLITPNGAINRSIQQVPEDHSIYMTAASTDHRIEAGNGDFIHSQPS
ncbi:hypothetical protein L1887_05932 [Cichorium endivia]|nr:hypothetical protein L1887_05932 [Cichorium endivia]